MPKGEAYERFNEILCLPLWHFWHRLESIFPHWSIIRIEITNGAFIQENKQSIYSDMKAPSWDIFDKSGVFCTALGKLGHAASGELGSPVLGSRAKGFVLDTATSISGLFTVLPPWYTACKA